MFFEVWLKVFYSHFMGAHYIRAFSLQDKQKISNALLSSHARTCGLKQQTNHSPFKGSLSDNTTANNDGAQKRSFQEKKASSPALTGLAVEWIPREIRGNRGHLQGPFLLPPTFAILKCISILNISLLLWRMTVPYIVQAAWVTDAGAGEPPRNAHH